MAKLSGIELKRARLVPSAVFASPDEVVASAALSRAQKISILRRWEFDTRGMEAGVALASILLHQIRQALVALGAATPGQHPFGTWH
jgi:hypothetical protein